VRGIQGSPELTQGSRSPSRLGFLGCPRTQTCWRWVGVPLPAPPPPSVSAPQGWTSRPTKMRRVTRRPTSWRSTRRPRNAPSGPTPGSTGPSPPTGASSPPPPQSESPGPSSSGAVPGLWGPLCVSQGNPKGIFQPRRSPRNASQRRQPVPRGAGAGSGLAAHDAREVPRAM